MFELFTAGVGVAGLVGRGLLHPRLLRPGRPADASGGRRAARGGDVGFAIDVQTGVPRVWTGIGATCSDRSGRCSSTTASSLSWITLLVGIGGISLFMLAGMPAMVRTRFSTPTIGREWMIGELGEAVATVDPDGVVQIRDALWRARTNRATPITAGDDRAVVEVDGLVLEVEPEEGGGRDYRERRSRT